MLQSMASKCQGIAVLLDPCVTTFRKEDDVGFDLPSCLGISIWLTNWTAGLCYFAELHIWAPW